jgi:hypothetical protein
MQLEQLEEKFIVLKWEDVEHGLTRDEAKALFVLLDKVEAYRIKQGKKPGHLYVVINTDEPYIQQVLDLLKDGE